MRVGATTFSHSLAGSRLENSVVAHELPHRRVCNLEHEGIPGRSRGAREGNEAETGAEMEIAADPPSSDCFCCSVASAWLVLIFNRIFLSLRRYM